MNSIRKLVAIIERDHEKIVDVLIDYEPYTTAEDEIKRSLTTLRGLEKELSKVKSNKKAGAISTFFPINLPLYSIVLFAIAPSYFTDTLYVRTSDHISAVLTQLADTLNLAEVFPSIKLKSYGRKRFANEYVKKSDVILFCGRYENAITIQKENPDALFIYNGSGINPAVVTNDADLDVAINKIVEMRTFNSGQDCAGIDCIFVEQSVYDKFLDKLRVRIEQLKIGQYGDKSINIGPVVREDYIQHIVGFLNKNSTHIIQKGTINNTLVSPFIIKKDIHEHSGKFTELFAPIFYILTYDKLSDVVDTIDKHKDTSMYISLFSKKDIKPSEFKRLVKIARVLRNKIVNDVENGNQAYGGYGAKANFIAHGSETTVRPVLISREIDTYLSEGTGLKSDKMSVTMLGSGSWEGTPAPFCRCKLCRMASKDILSIENRMRPGFYVKAENTRFLIEIGPDLRMQTAKFNLPKIKDYLVSHWHNDHLFGVFDLHFYAELVLKENINIYCSEEVADYIRQHIGYIPINVVILEPFKPFSVGSVKITPFPVYHMHVLDNTKDSDKLKNVFGFLLEYGDKRVAYLADYYKIPEKSLKLIKDASTVIADGTYLFEEKWPKKDLQNMTHEEKDSDHLHGDSITSFTKDLYVDKVVYHSISHLPGMTHNKLQTLLPENQYIGFDGMEIL